MHRLLGRAVVTGEYGVVQNKVRIGIMARGAVALE